MKIKSITLKNFRAYKDETIVEFGDLTTFVGMNDIGKSTVLEALDIFFNDGNGAVKLARVTSIMTMQTTILQYQLW